MTVASLETTKLEAIASQYRAKGYEVHVHPDRSLLPPFLFGFSPDLIAVSGNDKVVVQVKCAPEFDSEEVQKLARFIEAQPPWRYEVALIGLPTAPDVPAAEELASADEVNRLISNAELLSRQDHVEAAVLVAWSAAETIMRRLARFAAPELERQSSARLLKHLYALGRIEPDLYTNLSQLMTFRNAVAHGFAPVTAPPDVSAAIADIRRLQQAA